MKPISRSFLVIAGLSAGLAASGIAQTPETPNPPAPAAPPPANPAPAAGAAPADVPASSSTSSSHVFTRAGLGKGGGKAGRGGGKGHMAHMHLGTHGLKERNLDRAATSNAPEHTAGSKAAEENPKPSETH